MSVQDEMRSDGIRVGPIGIVCNPASGKDIRRLTARASVFDNQEKLVEAYGRHGAQKTVPPPRTLSEATERFGVQFRSVEERLKFASPGAL